MNYAEVIVRVTFSVPPSQSDSFIDTAMYRLEESVAHLSGVVDTEVELVDVKEDYE